MVVGSDMTIHSSKLVPIEQANYLRCHDVYYSHELLASVDQGVITLTPMPYKPSQYPEKPLKVDVYRHATAKVWCIGTHEDGELFTVYSNENTNWNLVYQELKGSKDYYARCDAKNAEGYRHVAERTFDPFTRTIEFS